MDGATGLTYMQQRYYDQQIGRFLSVDPVGADGSSGGNFNRYKYASNNPFRFTDPDGRQEVDNGNFWVGMVKAFRDAVAPLAHAIVDPQGTNIDPSYDRIGPGSGQVEQGGYKFGSALAVAEGAKGLSQGVGAIATGGGKVALSEAQAASLTRFEKKFSAANRGAEVSQTGKTVTFTNEVPGKVPGSKAVYEKSVDASGTTTSVKKTTVAPNGQVIHVKEKTN